GDPELYFRDMRRCIREMKRVLKPDKNCFILIGDAIVNGLPIPSPERLAQISEEEGLSLDRVIRRNIDRTTKSFGSGARIEHEHLICLRNNSKTLSRRLGQSRPVS